MSDIMPSASIVFVIVAVVVYFVSLRRSKANQFYSDTPLLSPLGIYVWGDGLVLGPFWVLSGMLWLATQLPLLWVVRYILLFWLLRSAYEVVYWLNHQAVGSDYCPPFGRDVSWLDKNEQHIIYQLFHTVVVVFSLFLLLYSYVV